ncbi:Transcription initiation factor TFIID subunit 2 [Knufia fluminis]|uniref:Transcription initiation factor TFIID subunit 2 n=1 Tax=Knufia fluminis TaxID=191047 RepID=A0AAN8I9Y8_9EURO|nr:Transcription initiation factor TFIID subunit 2 [Knufia fluminis]
MDAMQVDQVPNTSPVVRSRHYQLINQKVDLDIGFDQLIKGTSHLTIFPEHPDVKAIVLNARQCRIKNITVNGHKPDSVAYADPCDTLSLHTDASVRQHHVLQEKLGPALTSPPDPELVIILPPDLKIEKHEEVVIPAAGGVKSTTLETANTNNAEAAEGLADTAVSRYTPLDVIIEFESIHSRDALHFATGPPGSGKWPHVYSRGGYLPGRTSSLFPCMDSLYYRCTWEISITGPRTVGDALQQMTGESKSDQDSNKESRAYEAKEMVFICPGEITDDVVSKTDSSRRTVSYAITQNVSAQHIGFAIGPFEKVDLATFREADKLELLQENAAPIAAYCLPGRKNEVENTCLPTTEALDHFAITHAPYPFASFSYCFVDDHPERPASFAGLAVCSSRMLYPETVIDPAQEVTRTLVQALTTQWLGVHIIAKQPEDTWVVLGSAMFLAELFMKDLCGNNEHRFRMKQMSDRICQLDHQRPSIWDMGALLHVDPSEYEFLALKSPLVLYILDRRIAKTIGSPKISINIGKFMSKARNEDLKDNLLSTQDFCKMTEKVLHASIDDFINQWVKGAGCPRFIAEQRFNKKKLVIEMSIRQTQAENTSDTDLDPDTFMRDVREEVHGVWAAPAQHVFTGAMTIRIHEADGTPYEHIIDIKEAVTKVEVPYNTKYKRLKRSKKQRAKNAARAENDDEQEALVYCLGDVLQSEEEIAAWRITEWSEEHEQVMNSESYEWIRLDADFEWISSTRLGQPGHMFASQLQQDRDVAAQLISIQHIAPYNAGGLISSILVRTMMDHRYFHGIRTAAAQALVRHASNENGADMIGLFHLRKAFEELHCTVDGDTVMTRPNDFSDQLAYFLKCSMIEAMSKIRDDDGATPRSVKEFLLDKLKFNDNSQNEFSDAHYVSTLLKGLTSALLAQGKKPAEEDMEDDIEQLTYWAQEEALEKTCLEQIDRYRRMDEWTSSYQNLYSRTALECQARLSSAGIGGFSPLHFLQYARPGNYEMLRSSAFDILASADLFANGQMLQMYVHNMVASTSPYVRERLRGAFGKALARKALGYNKAVAAIGPSDALMVEGGAAPENDLARRTSVEGALDALKKELGDNHALKTALWKGLNFPEAGYEDARVMMEFCQMLYTAQDDAKVSLPLPRYWKMEMEGKGKIKFTKNGRVRTKRMERWQPKVKNIITLPRPSGQAEKTKPLKLSFGKRQSTSMQPGSAATTPTPPPAAAPPAPRTFLKLKVGRPSVGGQ